MRLPRAAMGNALTCAPFHHLPDRAQGSPVFACGSTGQPWAGRAVTPAAYFTGLILYPEGITAVKPGVGAERRRRDMRLPRAGVGNAVTHAQFRHLPDRAQGSPVFACGSTGQPWAGRAVTPAAYFTG